MHQSIPGLRSPHDRVGNLVYFGRMLDKIRLNLAGRLPEEYRPNLGAGFDERCVHFLGISYHNVVDRIRQLPDATDEELLNWALQEGRHPDDDDIYLWNEFMRKRGWKDEGSAILAKRKTENGLGHRDDIETMFQFLDADEGRS